MPPGGSWPKGEEPPKGCPEHGFVIEEANGFDWDKRRACVHSGYYVVRDSTWPSKHCTECHVYLGDFGD